MSPIHPSLQESPVNQVSKLYLLPSKLKWSSVTEEEERNLYQAGNCHCLLEHMKERSQWMDAEEMGKEIKTIVEAKIK